jgi:hypothetical protein
MIKHKTQKVKKKIEFNLQLNKYKKNLKNHKTDAKTLESIG